MENVLDPSTLDFYAVPGNSQKIGQIQRIYNQIEKYAAGIMECSEDSSLKSSLKRMKMEWKSERGYVKYYFPDTDRKAMLTVFYRDRLFSTSKAPYIFIVFELQGKYKSSLDSLESEISAIVSNYQSAGINLEAKTDGKNSVWRHLASQTILFKDLKDELPRLGEVVAEYINPTSPMIKMAKEVMAKLESDH